MNTGITSASATSVLTAFVAEPSGTAARAAPDVAAAASGAMPEGAGAIAGSGAIISWGGYFQSLAFLFLLVAGLFVLLWFLKRKGGLKLLTGQGDLVTESRMPLGANRSLLVVRFLNKRLLLGVTNQQITLLTELPINDDNPSKVPPEMAKCVDFNTHLDAAASRRRDTPG